MTQPRRTLDTKAPSVSLTPRNYAFLQQYVHTESGILIDDDKQYLLEARLNPLLRENNLLSLDALSEKLSKNGSSLLGKQVIDAMTTNETLFFRDIAMFDALRAQIITQLVNRNQPRRPLRIWSAASSSGQEAYSLAMMLLEMGYSSSSIEIVGTDISEVVLERARQGRYVHFEVKRGLSDAYLSKYFTAVGPQWQIKDEIRKMVRFERRDLRQDLTSMGRFDLVLCRNVLIYFDNPTKTKILTTIKKMLEPGGVLLLGCAETIINLFDGFQRDISGQTTFYKV